MSLFQFACLCVRPLLILFFLFLLHLWRYGSFSGHGLPVARVSRQLGFYDVRMSARRLTPNLKGQRVCLCPASRSKSVRHGWLYRPAWLSTFLVHARSHTRLNRPSTRWRHQRGVGCSWNVMAHGDAGEGKWRGNWRMEWVASTLHSTSEHGVSSITTAYAHTSAASSRLNWRPPPI